MQSSISITKIKCDNCGEKELILNKFTQEFICTTCGQVMGQKIENKPEWRSFEGEKLSTRRVGLPPTPMISDKGMSTIIGKEDEDSMGKRITEKTKKDLYRLRMWQRRINLLGSTNLNLVKALGYLNKLGEKLEIPLFVMERASNIYRMAKEKDLIRGRSIKTMVVAALYVAIRLENIPRSLKELSEISGQEKREIARDYKLLIKKLKLKIPIEDPVKYIKKICVRAGLDRQVMLEAQKILRIAQKERLTAGRDPTVMAAAATYYACILLKVKVKEQDIADAADVTVFSVGNRSQSLKDVLKLGKRNKQEIGMIVRKVG